MVQATATASRSSADQRDRSALLGRYWRSSPFVFSFVARCHGGCGSAKNTLVLVSSANWVCADKGECVRPTFFRAGPQESIAVVECATAKWAEWWD